MAILITGGLGYIGSYVAYKCISSGINCVILDDLSNSEVSRVNELKAMGCKKFKFIHCDIGDEKKLDEVFKTYLFKAVIHCAGKKSVPESLAYPTSYYDTNVRSSLVLLKTMQRNSVYNLIFSSSAAVYSEKNIQPVKESGFLSGQNNPYAETKLVVEKLCQWVANTDQKWKIGILRYFNPVGAHENGGLGDLCWRKTGSLFNNTVKFLKGEIPHLEVYGTNYDTKDGSCVRDFIHIDDLASAHISVIDNIDKIEGYDVWNVGTGVGTTVLEFIKTCERIVKQPLNLKLCDKRNGDLVESFCDVSKAINELKFEPSYNLEDMIKHGFKFHNLIY